MLYYILKLCDANEVDKDFVSSRGHTVRDLNDGVHDDEIVYGVVVQTLGDGVL